MFYHDSTRQTEVDVRNTTDHKIAREYLTLGKKTGEKLTVDVYRRFIAISRSFLYA